MTTLPRCPVKACPIRYRGGPDRLCPSHQDDGHGDITAAAQALGIDLANSRNLQLWPAASDHNDGDT